MSIRIFNTLGRRLEEFHPLQPPIVKAYFCGPTVYDKTHVGHIRAYTAFDFIKRYLRLRGFTVIHVQNITDIDDKIIKRAHEEGASWKDIADKYAKEYIDIMKRMKIAIDIHPRVSEHIREIIEFTQTLIDKGHAYVAPSGSVYFDVTTIPNYGELSGRLSQEEWRQEEEFLKEKKHPFDFAVWKAAKPGEPWWESPWGRGRPGWHTECVVMSSKYLGTTFDIHGGGQDLIFPHHENELAMAKAAFGIDRWVRYWIHVGYLTIRGEKMSKSLGNVVYADDAIDKWGPEALRLWIFSAHYRKQLEFSDEALERFANMVKRVRDAAALALKLSTELDPSTSLSDSELATLSELIKIEKEFHAALSEDFNTPRALKAVMDLVKVVNAKATQFRSAAIPLRVLSMFREFNEVLGVVDSVFEAGDEKLREALFKAIDIVIRVRSELRKRKYYDLSDWIRSELSRIGVKVRDYRNRSEWILEL
ncbi:MAG: cysteine--tRNA ligase [Crenarchaeota archaeon]|nr:cysteine--tRNA ligase [Thermoproteota archaeon]